MALQIFRTNQLRDTAFPSATESSIFLTEPCIREAVSALGVDARIIVSMDSEQAVEFCPAFLTTKKTYVRFHPSALLARLMGRCGRDDLQAALIPAEARACLVAAVPLDYASPLQSVGSRNIGAICEQLTLTAARANVSDVALLNLSRPSDSTREEFSTAGFHVARLDSIGVITLDPSWGTFHDYSISLGSSRGSKVRRERQKFISGKFQCEWRNRLSNEIVERAVFFENITLPQGDGTLDASWYQFVERGLPNNHRAFVVRKGNEIVAVSVVFLDLGKLIGKAIAVDESLNQEFFLKFNAGYYEPIQFALENRIASFDLGPEDECTKRRRGALPRELWGAFKFGQGHPAKNLWPEMDRALNEQHAKWWPSSRCSNSSPDA